MAKNNEEKEIVYYNSILPSATEGNQCRNLKASLLAVLHSIIRNQGIYFTAWEVGIHLLSYT